MLQEFKWTFGIGRFFATIAAIFWASRAVPLFKNFDQNPLPETVRLRGEIYRSLGISAILSVIYTLWLVPVGYWAAKCDKQKRQSWMILFCVVDWTMIALMIWSLVSQSTYLPQSPGECNYASTWRLSDRSELFVLMAGWTSCYGRNRTTPYPLCTTEARSSCRNALESKISSILTLSIVAFTALYPVLAVPIPWRIVRAFGQIRSLTISVTNLTSYRNKFNNKNAKCHPSKRFISEKYHSDQHPQLLTILHPSQDPTILNNLMGKLHYSDLKSLSLVSKSLYTLLHETSPLSIASLRSQTCVKGTISECWCCGIQICEDCQKPYNLPDPASKTHVDDCSPYCSACYYIYLCPRSLAGRMPPNLNALSRRRANNGPKPVPGLTTARCLCYSEAGELHPVLEESKQQRLLCVGCSSLGEKAIEIREEREMREMRHLMQGQRVRCVVCERSMHMDDLKWWGCGLCGDACVNRLHRRS